MLFGRDISGLGGFSQREQEIEKTKYREARSDLVDEYEQELRFQINTTVFSIQLGYGKGDPDLYKAFCNRFIDLNAKKIEY